VNDREVIALRHSNELPELPLQLYCPNAAQKMFLKHTVKHYFNSFIQIRVTIWPALSGSSFKKLALYAYEKISNT
jgi:hypothetical protein